MADEKKPLEYVGYVIDRGIPFDGIQKAVDFYDGVGILDREAIAIVAPAWFDRNSAGEIVAVHDDAVSMETFIAYWEDLGARVTPISETEAREIRAALKAKRPIDQKYLKIAVDTRAIAGAEKEPKYPPPGPGDDYPKVPPKGRGRK